MPPGKESTFVIGEYPVLSLEEARAERAALREMVKAGIRPADARRQEKQDALEEKEAERLRTENSFEAIALEWLTLKEPGWRASHIRALSFPCQRAPARLIHMVRYANMGSFSHLFAQAIIPFPHQNPAGVGSSKCLRDVVLCPPASYCLRLLGIFTLI